MCVCVCVYDRRVQLKGGLHRTTASLPMVSVCALLCLCLCVCVCVCARVCMIEECSARVGSTGLDHCFPWYLSVCNVCMCVHVCVCVYVCMCGTCVCEG